MTKDLGIRGEIAKLYGARDMKKKLHILLLTAFVTASSGCSVRPREDMHTHVLVVPRVAIPECREIILQNLGRIGGITKVEVQPDQGTLTVTFNSRITALKNIEFSLAEAGFDVDDSVGRAGERSTLPESCR